MLVGMKEEEEEEKHCADYKDDGVCGDNINFIFFTAYCRLASNITEHCYNEQASIELHAFLAGSSKARTPELS